MHVADSRRHVVTIDQLGCQLTQRLDNKTPLRPPRVWHFQVGLGHCLPVDPNDVDIERARPPTNPSNSLRSVFESAHLAEQFASRQRRRQLDHHV